MEAEDTSAPSSSCSRRRIAFREPPVLRERLAHYPAIGLPTTASTSEAEKPKDFHNETSLNAADRDVATPQVSTSAASDAKSAEPPKRKAWSFEEVCAFYEGIKIHGKDFDSVVKFMAKRKIEKTKDHVKTFFFNSVKAYRQLLSMTDDDFANISRDARELFLLVNACEWKRKTMNMKVIVDKLKELLFEGTVIVRVGRRVVTIKTPPCPALCRYFSVKKADKIPSEMYVHLEPTSNGDHVFMRSRNQNPYLRVKLNSNDRISKLLDFIQKKWSLTGDTSPVAVTLWPDSSCEIASLSVHAVENSPFISLSMNKLIKNVEETREKVDQKKPEGNNGVIKMATDVNIKTKPTQTVIYPRPFTLTDKVIAEGINVRNVRNAIVAELFCVCGRKNPIQLRYQVHSEYQSRQLTEPWRVMISLLGRGYGDCLAPNKNKKKEKSASLYSREPPAAKKKKLCDESSEPPPGNPVSEIVRQETEDFECQLALLRKTTRKKNAPAKRKPANPVLATVTPQLSIRPAGDSNPPPAVPSFTKQQIFVPPKCTVVPRRTPVNKPSPIKKFSSRPLGAGSTQPGPSARPVKAQRQLPIDFSSVVISPAKRNADLELMQKRTEEFLSSLKTPVDTPLQTPKKTQMQLLFGDDLSISPNSTRHASCLEPAEGTSTSVVDFTDMMYQHIKDHGDSTMSNPALEFSVSEVQQSYQDMMSSSQNSHDYIFGHFQKKKFTPKKKK